MRIENQVLISIQDSDIINNKFIVPEVILPDSINYLGDQVFFNCINLKSIKFSNSLKKIPRNTCLYCSSLEDIKLPNNLIELDGDSFSGCSSLKQINIPVSVQKISKHVFNKCKSLLKVNDIDVSIFDNRPFIITNKNDENDYTIFTTYFAEQVYDKNKILIYISQKDEFYMLSRNFNSAMNEFNSFLLFFNLYKRFLYTI